MLPAVCHFTADINGLIFSTQWILEEFKVKFLYLQQVCVMCSSILNRQIAKPSVHKTKSEISYISLQTPHIFWNVHCTIDVSTYPQNGDIVFSEGILVVTPVIISSNHRVEWSARLVVCGSSSYWEKVRLYPIYGKVLKFALCVVLP